MHDLIPLNIIIADRSYRIKIQPRDEEMVRKTVKTINEKIIEFKTQFAGKDMQDYIAMVLMWFSTEQNVTLVNELEKDGLTARLTTIEKMIDNQLSK